jgi:hypothetical protein
MQKYVVANNIYANTILFKKLALNLLGRLQILVLLKLKYVQICTNM